MIFGMTHYIAYYRVSTKRQNLGIDAQRTMIENYIKSNGGLVVSEYSEKESGKNDNRPQLSAALAECKRTGATLLIAKLDRLSRKVSFVFALRDSGAKFVACDLPQFNVLTLAVFCGLAEQEREMISQRTKDALVSRYQKESWQTSHANVHKFDDACRMKSLDARRTSAKQNEYNQRAFCAIKLALGTMGFNALADYLNENKFTTAKGGMWRGNQVKRLIEMYS
jgi:DNA invertase Pin-like site-specific DNA recombinase